MQLRKIKVYGALRKFVGKTYLEAAVNSPEQAFNFLKANFQGIENHMSKQMYKIKMGGRVITQDFLNMRGQGEIQIIPVAVGAGFFDFLGDIFETVTDFVSDVVTFAIDYALPIVTTYFTGGLTAALVVGGLSLASELLAPSQPISVSAVGDLDPSIRGSYSFNGIQNVSNAGVPVPIIYGRVFSGSILISSGVDTAQIQGTINQGDGQSTSGSASSSDDMTYTQSGNLITITATGHNFVNGQSLRLDFVTGPLKDSNVDVNALFGVQDVTTNQFRVSTGIWNSQNYSSSGNIVKVTERLG